MSDVMKNLKFKKKIIGGVDELDVLKKMKDLNDEYQHIVKRYEEKISILNKKLRELKHRNV